MSIFPAIFATKFSAVSSRLGLFIPPKGASSVALPLQLGAFSWYEGGLSTLTGTAPSYSGITDLSGNGRHITVGDFDSGNYTLNGNVGFEFDRANTNYARLHADHNDLPLNDFTFVMMVQFLDTTDDNGNITYQWPVGGENNGQASTGIIFDASGNRVRGIIRTGFTNATDITITPDTDPHFMFLRKNGTSTTIGYDTSTNSENEAQTYDTDVLEMGRLGGAPSSSTGCNCIIYHFSTYNYALSDSQLDEFYEDLT